MSCLPYYRSSAAGRPFIHLWPGASDLRCRRPFAEARGGARQLPPQCYIARRAVGRFFPWSHRSNSLDPGGQRQIASCGEPNQWGTTATHHAMRGSAEACKRRSHADPNDKLARRGFVRVLRLANGRQHAVSRGTAALTGYSARPTGCAPALASFARCQCASASCRRFGMSAVR